MLPAAASDLRHSKGFKAVAAATVRHFPDDSLSDCCGHDRPHRLVQAGLPVCSESSDEDGARTEETRLDAPFAAGQVPRVPRRSLAALSCHGFRVSGGKQESRLIIPGGLGKIIGWLGTWYTPELLVVSGS